LEVVATVEATAFLLFFFEETLLTIVVKILFVQGEVMLGTGVRI
jgi:hypothetical protein